MSSRAVGGCGIKNGGFCGQRNKSRRKAVSLNGYRIGALPSKKLSLVDENCATRFLFTGKMPSSVHRLVSSIN